ncbi:hypothetical protein Fmac_024063 [Flemingia macrophylla]|uniref:Oleosin n=1 Tax=Flemingia macrophylla TaxID=520843 RepID=A0ABD1LNB6_9FABA
MQPMHEKLSNTCHTTPSDAASEPSTNQILHLYLLTHSLTHTPQTLTLIHFFALPYFFTIMAELHYEQQNEQPLKEAHRSTQVVKAATAVTAGGSLLILAALILAGTVVALTMVTPLFVIFSPVLVPAVAAVALLSLGFLASGGFGVAAITVLAWIYRYVTGKHPPGADQLDTARHALINKAREIKDYGQSQITGAQAS